MHFLGLFEIQSDLLRQALRTNSLKNTRWTAFYVYMIDPGGFKLQQ